MRHKDFRQNYTNMKSLKSTIGPIQRGMRYVSWQSLGKPIFRGHLFHRLFYSIISNEFEKKLFFNTYLQAKFFMKKKPIMFDTKCLIIKKNKKTQVK